MSAGWTTATLGEIAQVVTGSTPSTSESSNFDGPYPFVTPTELDSIEPIRSSKTSLSELGAKQSRVLPAGAVLVCCIGSLGKVGIAGVPLVTNQQINALILNDRYVLPSFAFHYCKTLQPMMEHVAPSTTLKIINKSRFAGFRIAFPSLDEQQRIATILDKAEALRAKRRQVIAKQDEFLSALFMTTFGDPAINPKSWPVGPLGELLNSATYGTSEKADHTGKTPILRMGNLTVSGDIVLNDLKYIDLSKADDERYLVKQGDILFNRTNSAELVGKTAVFHGDEPMAYAGYLVRLRTNERAHPEYISAVLNSRYGKAVLRGMCKSIVGMANINAKEVQTIPIAHPPIDLQRRFAAQVTQVRTMKGLQRAALDKLDILFTSLQHRAFRGEL